MKTQHSTAILHGKSPNQRSLLSVCLLPLPRPKHITSAFGFIGILAAILRAFTAIGAAFATLLADETAAQRRETVDCLLASYMT
jgi:hypothetical protein